MQAELFSTPPSLSDVINSFKDSKVNAQNIVASMLKDGELIKINEELCFARATLDKLRNDWSTAYPGWPVGNTGATLKI